MGTEKSTLSFRDFIAADPTHGSWADKTGILGYQARRRHYVDSPEEAVEKPSKKTPPAKPVISNK